MCVDTPINYALSNPHFTASNNWLKLNNELEKIWKEEVMIKFRKLRRYLPESTE